VVAAVSNAGGFGVLGAVAHTPEQLEIDLAWIEEETNGKPYGVDLLLPQKYAGADEDGLVTRRSPCTSAWRREARPPSPPTSPPGSTHP
jgi:NAD(P)H-dependent flavin oxidoreductase YrpB (nitropropane dioxygenase family)